MVESAGQSVILGAQLVTVTRLVAYTVEVIPLAGASTAGALLAESSSTDKSTGATLLVLASAELVAETWVAESPRTAGAAVSDTVGAGPLIVVGTVNVSVTVD